MKRVFSAVMFILLVTSMVTLAFNVQPVKASGTIYIRADGSIDPPTARISTVDNITYTFTGDINDSIVIERDNIVVDGAGYAVEGTGSGNGITLSGRSRVTIENMEITTFHYGIYLEYSSNNIVSGNNITANGGYTIGGSGIYLFSGSNNSISGNNIAANNYQGIELAYSSNYNSISGNNLTGNNEYGIYLDSSSNNSIFHNNFINNTQQVYSMLSVNVWDNGYPSGGNYWSDYPGNDTYSGPCQNDTGSDNIADLPYAFDSNNADNFPLMKPFVPFENQTIYIKADGSIDPSGAPILRKGDLYTLTDDIFSDSEYGIVIERDNMTLDGAGHIAQGNGSSFEIYLFEIGNVTVQDVQIKTSLYGIFLKGASNCSICRNNITDNGMYGIALDWSYYNCIVGNNIENNDVGIFLYLRDSDYNTIYHNNIVNNIEPVLLNPPGTPFVAWDNGYPSGGNYWSDYTGTDLHSGPYQNETGSDGIGDTQYSIDSLNTDRYPLMNLWVGTRLLGDINGDRIVDIYDAILLANAYNSVPGKANWNPNADINGDNTVDIYDAIILASHYNQHYP